MWKGGGVLDCHESPAGKKNRSDPAEIFASEARSYKGKALYERALRAAGNPLQSFRDNQEDA